MDSVTEAASGRVRWLTGRAILIAAAVVTRFCRAESAESATPLLEGLARASARIESLDLEYQARGYSREFPEGTYLYRRILTRRPDQFLHDSAHGHAKLHWRDDPFRQRTLVRGLSWIRFDPVDRRVLRGQLHEDDSLPGSLSDEFFFIATGLWIQDRPSPGPTAILFHDLVAVADQYTLRPQREILRGCSCAVLERSGKDVMWVEESDPPQLLAREIIDPNDPAQWDHFDLDSWVQLEEGVALPQLIRRKLIRRRGDASAEEILEDRSIEVRYHSINRLTPSDFDWTVPSGALERDLVSNQYSQIGPPGYDFLDELVLWAQRTHPQLDFGTVSVTRASPHLLELAAALLGCVIVEIWLGLRRTTDRHNS